MGKFLKMLGYLILLFLVVSNYININLSNAIIILLGILSAVFMCIGIFINDEKVNKINNKFAYRSHKKQKMLNIFLYSHLFVLNIKNILFIST